MPTWGEILQEAKESAEQREGGPDWDGIRRKYLGQLFEVTGRNVIVFYTDWLNTPGNDTSINLEDMHGLMEVCRGLEGKSLDLLVHSPGGSAEATASIVRYLRRKFDDIRVFVPLAAMSAATMLALASNVIVMGKHSQLGPIDPQILTPQGAHPARAIMEQFERAKRECAKDSSVLGAWLPILQQYGPSLLEQCEAAEALSKKLVAEWLEAYMFAGTERAAERASQVAEYFADSRIHKSHALGIDRDQAREQGVDVHDLEDDQDLQDAVLSVHHATVITFQGAAVKLIENQNGKAFVRVTRELAIPIQLQPQAPTSG